MNCEPVVVVPAAWMRVFTAAEEILGADRVWRAIEGNDRQAKLLEFLAKMKELGVNLNLPELKYLVTWDSEQLNNWFKENGFDLKVDPFDDRTFGIGVIFKLLLKWLIPGIDSTVIHRHTGETFPAVYMEDGLTWYQVDGYPNPIIEIPTNSTDRVYLSLAPGDIGDEFDLVYLVQNLQNMMIYQGKCEAIFPMVDLRLSEVLEWLLGLYTFMDDGTRARVSQALRESKLALDTEGIRVEQAIAVAVTLEAFFSYPSFTIDDTFILWIAREGQPVPLVAALLPSSVWGDPNTTVVS